MIAMKRLIKKLGIFGVLLLMVGILTSCSQSNLRSTPEIALENYMATVRAGEIEKSQEFIHGAAVESYSDFSMGESVIEDSWSKKIQNTKGYKEYKKEMLKAYSEIEYEITDTHEKEGFDQKEFMIDLTMVDLDEVNYLVLEEITGEYVGKIQSDENEKDILEGFDKMYGKYAEVLKGMEKNTITGHIIFIGYESEKDDTTMEWVITGMDYELFNQLSNKKGF